MSRGPQTFKQGDVTKAIKAALKAGVKVARVEIMEGGRIVIHVENNETKPAPRGGMGIMAEIKLEYVNSYIDARGKPRHVFRRKGHKRVTIKGRPGSQEFMDHYHELVEKTGGASPQIGASKAGAGTIDAFGCFPI